MPLPDSHDARGVLYPEQLPTFTRHDVPQEVESLARWYWTSRWDLPTGQSSAQPLLPFPASNLVVQPEGVTLSGPTSRISVRTLTGRSWAFGVLLRPTGLWLLGTPPEEIVDVEIAFLADRLATDVGAQMVAGDLDGACTVMSE